MSALPWLLSAAIALSAGESPAPAAGHHIAYRYDSQRIVITLDKLERRPQGALVIPEPSSMWGSMPLYETSDAAQQRQWEDSAGVHAGDPWLIEAGGHTRFHGRIERLAVGKALCEAAIVAIVVIDKEDRERFEGMKEAHYLALPATQAESRPSGTKWREPSTRPAKLSPETAADLETSLAAEFRNQLADVRWEMESEYQRETQRGASWPEAWRRYDERLANGEGKLQYEGQELVLTPDGSPRLYIRARWVLEGRVVFLMGAWVKAQNSLQLEGVNVRPALWLRMGEFQHIPLDLEYLGTILNVTDYDADGWGEVIMGEIGYESFALTLYEYSARGLKETGIGFSGGC